MTTGLGEREMWYEVVCVERGRPARAPAGGGRSKGPPHPAAEAATRLLVGGAYRALPSESIVIARTNAPKRTACLLRQSSPILPCCEQIGLCNSKFSCVKPF
ncbi:hypothetical protein JYU34_001776 [Plutella xylostella]|uniref:Uncharacterized protein n=1 Tax=Plutella xylostella TaxID=51655 RepID=A0ABQ7R4V0_PLUXY|nr:hypothetical protein JYU34_001776 [Plutella xylostella]